MEGALKGRSHCCVLVLALDRETEHRYPGSLLRWVCVDVRCWNRIGTPDGPNCKGRRPTTVRGLLAHLRYLQSNILLYFPLPLRRRGSLGLCPTRTCRLPRFRAAQLPNCGLGCKVWENHSCRGARPFCIEFFLSPVHQQRMNA